MASSEEAKSLKPWPVVGVSASDTGTQTITGAPAGGDAVGIELSDGTVLTGSESGTTDGTYKITGRSGTTESKVLYFIL